MNVYREARLKAAKYNDKLSSREGAAELLNVHPSTIATYELDTVKNPSVDMVVLMADTYNAAELENFFCTHECPIGRKNMDKLELHGIDRLTIKTLNVLKDFDEIENSILEITEDGIIDNAEKPRFLEILDRLRKISVVAQEFELWAKKNLEK